MITGINESKISTKHISCKCECKFNGRKSNSNQWWNNDECRCECEKHNICEKDYIWNSIACRGKNGKYLACIMDNSAIAGDDVIESCDEETKPFQQILMKKKKLTKGQIFIFYLHFY